MPHEKSGICLYTIRFLICHFEFLWVSTCQHKKVLLRERKRHTARRVASTPYVVLSGYPPTRVPPTRVPPCQGTPPAGPGRVPPSLAGPGRVPPWLPHGILGNVAKHYGIWGTPPCGQWTDRQTRVKTLPSRRITYAGGNKSATQIIQVIKRLTNLLVDAP